MSYPGSKGQDGVWQRIIGQMRPHDVYIEGFAGSAKIFRIKKRATVSYLFDKDPGAASALGLEFIGRENVFVENCNFIEWLQTTCLKQIFEGSVIYCDPPYPLSTRKGREYYRHEMTDEDHVALLSALAAVKADVLISGYPCPLYDEALKDWRCIRYRTRTRGATVTECLWCNFPEPEVLHDWRFAGGNYRQRLYLSRLKKRWLAKLARMEPRQRGFVLNAITETYYAKAH